MVMSACIVMSVVKYDILRVLSVLPVVPFLCKCRWKVRWQRTVRNSCGVSSYDAQCGRYMTLTGTLSLLTTSPQFDNEKDFGVCEVVTL